MLLMYYVFITIFLIGVKTDSVLLSSVDLLKGLLDLKGISSVLNIFSCNEKDSITIARNFKNHYHFIQILKIREKFELPISPNVILIADLECLPEVILWSDARNLFANPFAWVFLYSISKSESEILRNFQNVSVLVDSDVTLAKLEKNNTFSLKKIYKHRIYNDIIEERMAEWNPENHFIFEPGFEMNRHRRRKNFQGTVLNSCIVITHNDSLHHLTDKRDKHIDSIAKVNYVLVEHLADFVNARLHYTVESTWGYKNEESKWSGMIGELTEARADIGGTALFITADRVSTIDYIAMTTKTRSKFVFREPKLSYVTNVFLLPFDRYVWISTIALLIITGTVLFVIVKWEWSAKKYGFIKEDESHMELRDSVSDVAILTFGAFCQQSTSAIPFSMPGRLTTVFLFISLMFLYTSYSANIVALLQSSSKSIQTLEDLLKSRLEIGVDDTVFNHFYFPNATEPIRKAIYQRKVAPPGQVPRYLPILEGVKRMRQGLFAFHMETGPGYKIVGELFEEGEKCGLQEIQYLQVPDPWLAIQKNSSFKESLKIGLFLIRESGLQTREIDAIYTKKPICANRGNSFISVGIVDCYAPAVVLAGGIVVSILLFFLEHYIHYRARWYREKLSNSNIEEFTKYFYKHHFGVGSPKLRRRKI